jgi:hypothetical protein
MKQKRSRPLKRPSKVDLFERVVPKLIVVKLDINFARLMVRSLRGATHLPGLDGTDVAVGMALLADAIAEGEKSA